MTFMTKILHQTKRLLPVVKFNKTVRKFSQNLKASFAAKFEPSFGAISIIKFCRNLDQISKPAKFKRHRNLTILTA